MQMENIKAKFFDILIIALALIVANNIYKAQSKNILSLKERKAIELKRLDVLSDISKSYDKINVIKGFINNKDISAMVNALTGIARESNIKIDSLKPGKEEEHPDYIIYPFELIITSDSYHDLGKFLSRLESSAEFYIVRNLSFGFKESNSKAKNRLEANLAIATMLIKD